MAERDSQQEVGDIVEAPCQTMLEFFEARRLLHILPNYGFIWQQIQNIPLMQGPLPPQLREQPSIDWCLQGQMLLLQATSNLSYHCSI